MRYCLFVLLLINPPFSFSQTDSKKNAKRHSIGLFYTPIQNTYWIYNIPQYDKYPNEDRPKRNFPIYNKPLGICYQYKPTAKLNFQGGFFYSNEFMHYYSSHFTVNCETTYISIPMGIRFYKGHMHNQEALGGFFIQFNADFDIIIKEDSKRVSENYSNTKYVPPLGFQRQRADIEETHSTRIRFNRIRPSIELGHEIVFNHISFFYGARIGVPALLQLNNTQEIFRNFVFNPILVGCSYRF